MQSSNQQSTTDISTSRNRVNSPSQDMIPAKCTFNWNTWVISHKCLCIPVKSTFGWSHTLGGRVNCVTRGRNVCCALFVTALHKFDWRLVM